MDKVYESEMFVEHATVVLDALLEIGDAHILVAITLQGAQEGLFSEAGDLLRYAAESLETLWGRRLLELGKEAVQLLGSPVALCTLFSIMRTEGHIRL